jgi:hypothetical protein
MSSGIIDSWEWLLLAASVIRASFEWTKEHGRPRLQSVAEFVALEIPRSCCRMNTSKITAFIRLDMLIEMFATVRQQEPRVLSVRKGIHSGMCWLNTVSPFAGGCFHRVNADMFPRKFSCQNY